MRSRNNTRAVGRAAFEKIYWSDIRTQIFSHNHLLGKILDELDAPYPLYKVNYPFGSEIIAKGNFYFPDQKGFLRLIENSQIANPIKADLIYSANKIPMGIVLKNSMEFFVELEHSTIPLQNLFKPGQIFGSEEILNIKNFSFNLNKITHLTAGARSIFLLPKITEREKYNRLKKYFNLRSEMPKKLVEQWHLFKEISCHTEFQKKPWQTEILFFTKDWFQYLSDPKWQNFKNYLLQNIYENNQFYYFSPIRDLIFSHIQEICHIKSNSYLVDTVNHLLTISMKGLPGFIPVVEDNGGPFLQLQKVFNEIYQLESYAPIFMQPASLNSQNRQVYYSLQYPTISKFWPRSRPGVTKINELFEVKFSLQKIKYAYESEQLKTLNEEILKTIKNTKFTFFHCISEQYQDIYPSQAIPLYDPLFKTILDQSGKNFPDHSTFWCGSVCIKNS